MATMNLFCHHLPPSYSSQISCNSFGESDVDICSVSSGRFNLNYNENIWPEVSMLTLGSKDQATFFLFFLQGGLIINVRLGLIALS